MIPDNLPKSQEFSSLAFKEKKILNNQADKNVLITFISTS